MNRVDYDFLASNAKDFVEKNGMKHLDTQMDGNCLLHSVLHGMKEIGLELEMSASEFRSYLFEHVKNHDVKNGDIDIYLRDGEEYENLSHKSAFLGEETLVLISHLFCICIVAMYKHGDNLPRIYGKENTNHFPIVVWFVPGHYEKADYSKIGNIQDAQNFWKTLTITDHCFELDESLNKSEEKNLFEQFEVKKEKQHVKHLQLNYAKGTVISSFQKTENDRQRNNILSKMMEFENSSIFERITDSSIEEFTKHVENFQQFVQDLHEQIGSFVTETENSEKLKAIQDEDERLAKKFQEEYEKELQVIKDAKLAKEIQKEYEDEFQLMKDEKLAKEFQEKLAMEENDRLIAEQLQREFESSDKW
jgi:hypothetical protein